MKDGLTVPKATTHERSMRTRTVCARRVAALARHVLDIHRSDHRYVIHDPIEQVRLGDPFRARDVTPLVPGQRLLEGAHFHPRFCQARLHPCHAPDNQVFPCAGKVTGDKPDEQGRF